MKFSFYTILLIIGFLNSSTCVSRKKNISNLFTYPVFYKDGDQEESNRFEQRLDFAKYDGFYPSRESVVVLPPIKSFVPYSYIKRKFNYQQKPFNDLDPINNEIFHSRESTSNHDLYRLHRKKRRIIKDYDTINTNHNKIEIITTPKPILVEKNTNDVKPTNTYEVYDLESDANEIDFNHIFKMSPFDKKAVEKGHGYLTFGKRYTFYVSTNPVTKISSKANENSLAEPEDDVTDTD